MKTIKSKSFHFPLQRLRGELKVNFTNFKYFKIDSVITPQKNIQPPPPIKKPNAFAMMMTSVKSSSAVDGNKIDPKFQTPKVTKRKNLSSQLYNGKKLKTNNCSRLIKDIRKRS